MHTHPWISILPYVGCYHRGTLLSVTIPLCIYGTIDEVIQIALSAFSVRPFKKELLTCIIGRIPRFTSNFPRRAHILRRTLLVAIRTFFFSSRRSHLDLRSPIGITRSMRQLGEPELSWGSPHKVGIMMCAMLCADSSRRMRNRTNQSVNRATAR